MNGDYEAALSMLASGSEAMRRCEQAAALLRKDRDGWIVALARDGARHALIAEAAGITPQAVGKITRAAGLHRGRPPDGR